MLNWEAIGAIGELVGALGVIASLVYLGVQIRQNTRHLDQNTRATRGSLYHQANEQGWLTNLAVAENEDVAALVIQGLADPESLNEQDRARFTALMTPALFAVENTLRLYEQGLIDEQVWKNYLENSLTTLRLPGARWLLSQRPGVLSARLREATAAGLDAGPAA